MPKVMEIIEKETKGKSYHTYKYSYDSIGLPSINRFNRHLHLNKKCTCSKLSKCRNQFVSYLLFHRFTS